MSRPARREPAAEELTAVKPPAFEAVHAYLLEDWVPEETGQLVLPGGT